MILQMCPNSAGFLEVEGWGGMTTAVLRACVRLKDKLSLEIIKIDFGHHCRVSRPWKLWDFPLSPSSIPWPFFPAALQGERAEAVSWSSAPQQHHSLTAGFQTFVPFAWKLWLLNRLPQTLMIILRSS